VALHQHHARGGHVQRQAQQRGHQQHGGQRREVQRLDHLRDETIITTSAMRDVEGEQQVQHEGRQRQHHHRQHHHDEDRQHQRLHGPGAGAAEPAVQLKSDRVQRRIHVRVLRPAGGGTGGRRGLRPG
jgi:hypothetical protein